MDGNVAEKHVQEHGLFALNHRENTPGFRVRNLPRMAGSLFRSTRQKSPRRALDDFDAIDRPISFALLSYDNRPEGSQADDVPVDVQHFRLEKCRAEKRDRRRHGSHSCSPLAPRAGAFPTARKTHHSTLATTNPVE